MDVLLEGIQRKPYAHQLHALERFRKRNAAMLLWEMGTGKTGAAILLARQHYYYENKLLRTLVIAPPVTLHNWKNEWALWSKISQDKICVLSKGSVAEKAKGVMSIANSDDPDRILIINYEQMIQEAMLKALATWRPELLILDECHYLKSPTSKRTKMVTAIADTVQKKIMLTGTPILNNVKDIYSQFRILDHGESFGTNYYVFQAKYLRDVNAGWAHKPNHFPKLVNNEKMFPELTEKIYQKADRKTKDECLDLPPLIKIVEKLPLGKDQKKAYDDMVRDFLAFVKHETDAGKPKAVVASTAMVKALRLLQIASGYASTDEQEIHEFKDNPKLARTHELLEELTPDHKVILWCSFRQNYRMLERVCKELGVKYVMLTGSKVPMRRMNQSTLFRMIPK